MEMSLEAYEAAEKAYDTHGGVHSFALEAAVKAALETVAPDAVDGPPAAGMTRAEALEKAQEMTAHLADPPLKSNGYVKDGWKQPTLDERTTQILRLAAFLIGTAGEV